MNGRITKEELNSPGFPSIRTMCFYIYNFNFIVLLLVLIFLTMFYANNILIQYWFARWTSRDLDGEYNYELIAIGLVLL